MFASHRYCLCWFSFFLLYLVQPHFRAPLNYVQVQDDCSALSYANVQFHNVQLFLINFDCFSHDGAMRYGSKTLLHTLQYFGLWAWGRTANSFIRKEGRDKWWWLWSENENDKSNFKWEISRSSLGQGRHVCWDASKTTEGAGERGCVRGYGKKSSRISSASEANVKSVWGEKWRHINFYVKFASSLSCGTHQLNWGGFSQPVWETCRFDTSLATPSSVKWTKK